MKVTSIQESVDMSTLTLDSLYTKLKTHEMNILSRKVDSKSSALVSPSTSLLMALLHRPLLLYLLLMTMSDDQLEQFEEELALTINKLSRTMNDVKSRK
jgi:hypothetical protein